MDNTREFRNQIEIYTLNYVYLFEFYQMRKNAKNYLLYYTFEGLLFVNHLRKKGSFFEYYEVIKYGRGRAQNYHKAIP